MAGAGGERSGGPGGELLLDGRYLLRGALGQGGMGVVHRALDRTTGREVAVKLLREAWSPGRLERFQREGRIAAGLDHPGIVRVHSAGEARGVPYLVMELIEGGRDLAQVLPHLDLEARVRLVRDAAAALGYAHQRGVVHRDVKPDNLLVDATGRIRVADFGLATAASEERLTRTGAALGTPYYMAPEQFEGRTTGPPADVWGLGAVLYQALSGEPPFQGENLLALRVAISRGAPRLKGRVPDVSPALEAVCFKALALDPRERYYDGAALAADLDRALRGDPVAARAPRRPGQGRLLLLGLGLALVIWGSWLLPDGASVAVGPQPSPPASPASSPPARSPTPDRPAEAPAGVWQLRPGQAFPLVMAWFDRHEFLDGRVEDSRLELSCAARVRDLQDGLATLDLSVERVVLAGGGLVADSATGGALIPVEGMVGGELVLRFRLPSGEVRHVIGLTALRDALVERTRPELRQAVAGVLSYLDDATSARMLELLLHHGDGEAPAEAPGWDHRSTFWLQKDLALELPGQVRRQGAELHLASAPEGWRIERAPAQDRVEAPRLAMDSRWAAGRVVSARGEFQAQVRSRGRDYRLVYRLALRTVAQDGPLLPEPGAASSR